MSLASTPFCDITIPKTRPQYPLRVVVRTAQGNPPESLYKALVGFYIMLGVKPVCTEPHFYLCGVKWSIQGNFALIP